MYQSLPPHQDITPSIPASVSESEGVVRDVREQVGSIQLQMMPDDQIVATLRKKGANKDRYSPSDIISAVLGPDVYIPLFDENIYRICYKKVWKLILNLNSHESEHTTAFFEERFLENYALGMIDDSPVLSAEEFAESWIKVRGHTKISHTQNRISNPILGVALILTRIEGLFGSQYQAYAPHIRTLPEIDHIVHNMIPANFFADKSGKPKDPIDYLHSLNYVSDLIHISCLGVYHWLHDSESMRGFIASVKARVSTDILRAPTPFLRSLGQAFLDYSFEEYLHTHGGVDRTKLPKNYARPYFTEVSGYEIHTSEIKTNRIHARLPDVSSDELKTTTHAIFGGNTNLLDAVLGFSMDSMDIPMHLRILLLSFLIHADEPGYHQARSYLQRSKNKAELSERISSLLGMVEHPRALEQLTHLEMLLIERLGDKKGKKAFHGILQKYHDVTGVVTGQDIKLDTAITGIPTEAVDHEKVSKSLISYADRIIKDAIDGIEHGEADYALQKVSQIKHKLAQHVRISTSVVGNNHDQVQSLSDTLSALRIEMKSISAKDLTQKDIKFLYGLYEQQYHGRVNRADIIDTSLKTYLDDKNSKFYFFSYDKSPFLTLRCTQIDEQSVELGAFFSRSEAQGTQIAGYLIGRSFLQEIPVQNIYASVDPKAQKLIKYYQEFGFRPIRDGDISQSIDTHPNGTQSLRLIYRKISTK